LKRRDPKRSEKGFTLVELMVAMVLSTIMIAMAMQISVIVITGYRNHRHVVGVQRAARGSLDLIADTVRNASAGVPSGAITDASGCTDRKVLEVVNHDDAPDELYVSAASGGVVTSIRADLTDSDSTVDVLDGSGLALNDLVLVTDFKKGHILKINAAPVDNGTTWTLHFDSYCSGSDFHYPRGALIIRFKVGHFYIDDVDGVPTMFFDDDSDGPDDAQPVAEGVEDFQVAVGVDSNGDGGITDTNDTTDEWFYNAQGDDDPPEVTTLPWRALRMTLTARTTFEDTGGDWSARPTAEDRVGGATDGFKRRTVSTIVEIRNLTGSP
jgi:prepilin-type N-terminal cleavage/methylation domain-containing protein